MNGCGGGGGLYRVNPSTGAYAQVGGKDANGWANSTVMTAHGDSLYIVCGRMGGCEGGGGLWRVNPVTGTYAQVGGKGWRNAVVIVV